MPHLIVEYSNSLDFPVQPTLKNLHQILADSGIFGKNDIKVRAREYNDYLVDGSNEQGFVHLTLFLLDGRSEETKGALSRALAAVVQKATTGQWVQISVDMRDMMRATYTKIQNKEAV